MSKCSARLPDQPSSVNLSLDFATSLARSSLPAVPLQLGLHMDSPVTLGTSASCLEKPVGGEWGGTSAPCLACPTPVQGESERSAGTRAGGTAAEVAKHAPCVPTVIAHEARLVTEALDKVRNPCHR